jgi:hypothetical protein
MFHWFDVITNTRGDALAGWQVGLVDVGTQTVVPIFSDENETPIATSSGVTNRAVADENGNYDFFVANGTYTLQFFNTSGVFQRDQRFVAMYGAQNPATVRTVTGTSYALTAADENAVLLFTNGSAITVTLPADADAAYPVGGGTEFHQDGAGQITFVAGSGATLNARGGLSTTVGQYSIAGVRKKASDTFGLAGDLA